MEKKYNHKDHEERIYKMWESGGYFKPGMKSEKGPYTIVLPPPNASGKMHTGNVLMIAIEDCLIRWKRMQGYDALWLPGTDHAGFETQTTFERHLKKEGKSRFDFDRNTLYKKIMKFVSENKVQIDDQMREMGASVDWSRYSFTLDPHSLETVTNTFKKMEGEGLVYRDDYIVNYSFKWGTTFSDAEIVHKEQITPLYYVRYKLIDKKGTESEYIVLATVRPEPIFIDTHLAVNPKDKRNKHLIGRRVLNPLTDKEMKIIADDFVDPDFGTGIVKLTPGHDKNDFAVAKKHGIEVKSIITLSGKMNENAGDLEGLFIKDARAKVVEILKDKNLLEKVDEKYKNLLPVDYRSGDYIENLILPNWFIKVKDIKKPAYDAVRNGEVKIYPKWREKTYLRWMESMHDWAISRQIVWGIRIPVWYNIDENPNIIVKYLTEVAGTPRTGKVKEESEAYGFENIEKGLQTLVAPKGAKYIVSNKNPGDRYLQETDTFDTWFSSGQWPLITLKYPNSEDFKYFYPTSVLETGWEIVTRWVSRMMMFGFYATGKAPFKDIYLHGIVKALDGKKMSKSLGNVINPDKYLEEFGADALRMGLIAGTANGKDFNFPHDKVVAYRNFANKIWNIARFMNMMFEKYDGEVPMFSKSSEVKLNDSDRKILSDLDETIKSVDDNLEKYRFAQAGESIYHYIWDDLASTYIELVKSRKDKDVALSVLRYCFIASIKLLHPFMPFVTEAIWQEISRKYNEPLIITKWPTPSH